MSFQVPPAGSSIPFSLHQKLNSVGATVYLSILPEGCAAWLVAKPGIRTLCDRGFVQLGDSVDICCPAGGPLSV